MRRRFKYPGALVATGALLFAGLVVTAGCGDGRQAASEVAPQPSKGLPSAVEEEQPAAVPEPATSPAGKEAADREEDRLMKFEEANGYEIYRRYCLVCHGAEGDGVGFNAYNLSVKPRSLIDRYARERLTDEELARAIILGGAARNKSPLMPGWGNTLNARQVRYVIAYIRLLQRKSRSAEVGSEPRASAPGELRRESQH